MTWGRAIPGMPDMTLAGPGGWIANSAPACASHRPHHAYDGRERLRGAKGPHGTRMNDLRRTPAEHGARPWKQRLQADCFGGRDGGVVIVASQRFLTRMRFSRSLFLQRRRPTLEQLERYRPRVPHGRRRLNRRLHRGVCRRIRWGRGPGVLD